MPTTVTVIVDPDNGTGTDYTSLSAAEAAEQRDLVSSNEILIFECRSSSGTADTNVPIEFQGWTTDATRYIVIQSSGSNKHSGTFSTSKYRISLSQTAFGAQYALWMNEVNCEISGIQITGANGYGGNGDLLRIYQSSGATARVHDCILRGTDSINNGIRAAINAAGNTTISVGYFYNNLILLDFQGTGTAWGIRLGSGNGSYTAYVENNTIIRVSSNTNTVGIENTGSVTPIARNNLVYNFGNTNTYVGTFITGTDYNTTDSTDSIGTGSNNSTSQTFTFTNSAGGDYSLAGADTGAKNKGSALLPVSTRYTTDIIGTARPSSGPIDCGCFESIITTTTKIVDPDNGGGTDYTSLSAAEAAEQANLVTANKIMIFECRSTSGTADTTAVTVAGWTTDVTCYIKIQSTGANQHSGTWSTSKYRLAAGVSVNSLIMNQANVHLKGLQIDVGGGFGSAGTISAIFDGGFFKVEKCILRCSNTTAAVAGTILLIQNSGSGGTTFNVFNNLFIVNSTSTSGDQTAISLASGNATLSGYIENNTIVKTTSAASLVGILESGTGSTIVRNNLVNGFGNTTTYAGTFAYGSNYNTTDSTDVCTGSNNSISQTFTFTNSGAGDYSLASGDTGAKGRGSNLSEVSSGFTDDIIGTARPASTIDCGCFEYVSAATTNFIFIRKAIPGKINYPFVLNHASQQAQGLVGWWPGDGAGGKLWDRSGRGQNGTLTNFAAPFTASSGWVAGKDGRKGGLIYDGSDDRVDIANSPAMTISGTTAFSYSMWLLFPANPVGNFKTIFARGYDGSSIPYFLDLRGDTGGSSGTPPYLNAGGYNSGTNSGWGWGATSTIDLSQSANIGVWWHVAAVYDTGTVYLYLNGKLNGSGTRYSVVNTSYANTIGYLDLAGSPGRFTNVIVEDLRFYRRALSASDVFSQYDPRTRWELRYVPSRVVYFVGTSSFSPYWAARNRSRIIGGGVV